MMRRRVRRRDERTTRPPSAIVAPGRLLARTCTLPRPHAQSRPAGDSRAGRSPRRPLINKNIRLRPSFVALYMVIWCLSACPGYTVESSVLCLWVAYAYECVWTLRRYCLYYTQHCVQSLFTQSLYRSPSRPSGELPTETRVERRAHRRATDRAPFCFSIWISGFRASRLMFRVDRVGRSP